jgi:PhzF family phenazine biosynthesis protein
MLIPYYQVSSFSSTPWEGNQAGICLCEQMLDKELMQRIATENDLPSTAFCIPHEAEENNHYKIYWFSPVKEVDLCGHAALAVSHILWESGVDKMKELYFHSMSGIICTKRAGKLIAMDLPRRAPKPVAENAPYGVSALRELLGIEAQEVWESRDLIVVLKDQQQLEALNPDLDVLKGLPYTAVSFTAESQRFDFVSRTFAPSMGIGEDAVTGGTHSSLVPLWAEKLEKKDLLARQLSNRGGTLYCRDFPNHVELEGTAFTYLKGNINIP